MRNPVIYFIHPKKSVRERFARFMVHTNVDVRLCSSIQMFWRGYDPHSRGGVLLDLGDVEVEDAIALGRDARLRHHLIAFTENAEFERQLLEAVPEASVIWPGRVNELCQSILEALAKHAANNERG